MTRGLLEQVLEAAIRAPSAHNRQPWRFLVLEGEEVKSRLAEEMGANFRDDLLASGADPQSAGTQVRRARQRLVQAPAVIILCLDPSVGDVYPDARRQAAEHLMGVQGVAMAGQNLLLAAHALGLGGVWVCGPLFAQEAVRRVFDLPEAWEPQGMVLLGYPLRVPPARERLPVEAVTRFYS